MKGTTLFVLGGMAGVGMLALILIVQVVIRGPYTHHNIMETIDPNYRRTALGFAGSVAHAEPVPAALNREVSFSKDVSPILKNNCVVCHSPLKNSPPPAKLDFTSYHAMMQSIQAHQHAMEGEADGHGDGHDHGDADNHSEQAARHDDGDEDHDEQAISHDDGDGHAGGHKEMIVAGKPEESMLVEVLRSPARSMPPITTARLSEEEKRIIATWIGQGAKNN